MNKLIPIASLMLTLTACGCRNNSTTDASNAPSGASLKDTFSYPYKATYSSDLTVVPHPEYAQKVLTVWKMFENKQFDAMRPYYADTVGYDDASGMHYYGSSDGLLAFAKKETDGLDSLRFDISAWQSVHSNDKNEDWVQIWSTERNYPKQGKPDTVLMQENWQVKDGKVVYFNQYIARQPKKH